MRNEWEIAAAIGALMRITDSAEDSQDTEILAAYACALEWALGFDMGEPEHPCIGALINEAARTGESIYGDRLKAYSCDLMTFLIQDDKSRVIPFPVSASSH